jgi:hypothetical protein
VDSYEICKKVAVAEGFEVLDDVFYGVGQVYIKTKGWCNTDHVYFDTAKRYMPIESVSECFRLMVKYKIELKYQTDLIVTAVRGGVQTTYEASTTEDCTCLAICSEVGKI